MNKPAQADDHRVDPENASKYLTFTLGSEHYGVEILRIREIIGLLDITPMPNTPDYIKGVINLRGKIIPVIDLRMKFALHCTEFTEETCVIVVEVTNNEAEERSLMGVIVDSVSEVVSIAETSIEPTPRFGAAVSADFIRGLGKTEISGQDRVLILLDIDRAVSDRSEDVQNDTGPASLSVDGLASKAA